jgi:putative ABC transport system permease protein
VRALPFSGNGGRFKVNIPGQPTPPPGEELLTLHNAVLPNAFQVLGIPLLRGRNFTDHDIAGAEPVVMVNEKFAARAWPGLEPLGRPVEADVNGQTLRASVIGVVGNAKHFALEDDFEPQIYSPYAQDPFIFSTLVVRTKVDPMSLQQAVRQAVWSVDPQQPVWKIRTIEMLMDRSVGDRRAFLRLVSLFAGLALLLAMIGTYGVMSWMVGQRTHEIGIRMALGARARDVVTDVMQRGLRLTLAGVLLGLAGSLAAWRGLRSLLYGVSGTDAPTILVVVSALSAAAMLASLLPARRATKVDPMVALRYE